MTKLTKSSQLTQRTVMHKDGSLWAQGGMRGEAMHGYWEWFRRDGTRLRSGYFDKGVQVGEWTTYDTTGAVYKVTVKPTAATGAVAITSRKTNRVGD